jgi:ubiquinone/menaquinone biosynthesis C-methylase UbiE
MSEKPVALAHEAIHEKVEAILKQESRGKILDVPSGEGALALRLKNLGFDVFCADLYPQIFKLENVENRQVNLDEKLPYSDNSFDYIVCVEGLEHIENPANAIREFSRLLKQNGTLVVSVPNIMNIEERLKWLFNGYTSHFKPLSKYALEEISREYSGIEEIALHINPIGYSEIRYLLEKYGFELLETTFDKAKKNSWAYLPIIALIRLASKFSSAKKRENRWTNELNSNETLLGGNTLIFKARKK